MTKILLLLAALLFGVRVSAQVVSGSWTAAITETLPEVETEPAEELAGASEDFLSQVYAPIIEKLGEEGLTLEQFAQSRDRARRLARVWRAHSEKANRRALEIIEEAADLGRATEAERLEENVNDAERLIIFERFYLQPRILAALEAVRPSLDKAYAGHQARRDQAALLALARRVRGDDKRKEASALHPVTRSEKARRAKESAFILIGYAAAALPPGGAENLAMPFRDWGDAPKRERVDQALAAVEAAAPAIRRQIEADETLTHEQRGELLAELSGWVEDLSSLSEDAGVLAQPRAARAETYAKFERLFRSLEGKARGYLASDDSLPSEDAVRLERRWNDAARLVGAEPPTAAHAAALLETIEPALRPLSVCAFTDDALSAEQKRAVEGQIKLMTTFLGDLAKPA